MAEDYQIQPEKYYSDAEKHLCSVASKVCKVKVCLGSGQKSWTDGEIIIIDKKEHSQALAMAQKGLLEISISLLSRTLADLMAKISLSNDNYTDTDLISERFEAALLIVQGIARMKNSVRGRKPMMLRTQQKKSKFDKRVFVEDAKLRKKVKDSIKQLPVKIVEEDDVLIITSGALTQSGYVKITSILKLWNENFNEIKVFRGSRGE